MKHFQNAVLMYFWHVLQVKLENGGKIRWETKCSEIKSKENAKMGERDCILIEQFWLHQSLLR